MDKILKMIEQNRKDALEIFDNTYECRALEEGTEMLDDPRYVPNDDYDDWEGYEVDLYEKFASQMEFVASYDAAKDVIYYFSGKIEEEYDIEDQELQEEVMTLLDRNPYF